MFSYKQLLAFVTVVETGGFTVAARTLYMTQPAISWQIKSLEEDVGFQLIERGERNVNLTEAGQLFFRNARKILNQYESLQNDIMQYRNLEKGQLKIGGSTIPGEYLLPEYIGMFKELYPRVNISLEIADSATILEKLDDEEISLGLVGSKPLNPRLETEVFVEDRLQMVVGPEHPFSRKEKVTLKEAIAEPVIMREEGSGTRSELLNHLKKQGINRDRINIQMELGSTRACITAVECGLGVSWISEVAVGEPRMLNRLKTVQVENFEVCRPFYIVYNRNRTLSPLAVSYRSFLLENRKKE